jgi:alkylated DNA repair dioxygenase AlkB
MTKPAQIDLFEPRPLLPAGFKYQSGLLSCGQESELVARLTELPFRNFEFQGFLGKRRVVSFGWKYDFNNRELLRTEDIPDFLLPLRDTAARFAGLAPEQLQQVLVTEYSPGATIGWHRDKAVFGEVVGFSLLSSCIFRLRRKAGGTWERASIVLEPRSVYLLRGPARTEWEHSIPAVASLRYSVTFRNFKAG